MLNDFAFWQFSRVPEYLKYPGKLPKCKDIWQQMAVELIKQKITHFCNTHNKGQLRPSVTRPWRLYNPLCHAYFEPSGHEDSQGPPVPGAKKHPEMPGNKYFSSFGQLWVIQSPFRLKRVRLGTKISTDGWSSYEHFQELDCVVFAHCMMT